MQNNNSLITLSLDNLNTVTGGYHDPSGSAQPSHGSGGGPAPRPQGTLGTRLGQLICQLPSRFRLPARGK
jgi:hypothetical protein